MNICSSELKAVVKAFYAELKAGTKTAEAIRLFAVAAMDSGVSRADATKALAVEVRAALIAAQDGNFMARLMVAKEAGKDLTSLHAVSPNIENRWHYVCRMIGYAANEANANKGRRNRQKPLDVTVSGSQPGQSPLPVPEPIQPELSLSTRSPDTDSITNTVALSTKMLKSKDARAELFSHVGALTSKDRVSCALELLANLTDAEVATVLSKMTARKVTNKAAA